MQFAEHGVGGDHRRPGQAAQQADGERAGAAAEVEHEGVGAAGAPRQAPAAPPA